MIDKFFSLIIRFFTANRDKITELEKQIDSAKELNSNLKESIIDAEKINNDFAEHLKKLITDIDELHKQISEKDIIIKENTTFKSDIPFNEVRAPWMIKADNLHIELDKIREKLKTAEEAVMLKDTEIALLNNELHSKKYESVYCERVGFYCTPHIREEWR